MVQKVLSVRFQNGNSSYRSLSTKTYDYIYSGDKVVAKADIAVVLSPSTGYCCTIVTAVRDATPFDELKPVVEVVSFAAERKTKAIAAKKAKLLKQLKAKVTEAQEMKVLEIVAKSDPDVAELLKELKTLG